MNEKAMLLEEKEGTMAVVQLRDDEQSLSLSSTYVPFSTAPKVQENDLPALISDFFDWLETEWQLPVFAPETIRNPLPPRLALTEERYSIQDLVDLYGCSSSRVSTLLGEYQVGPVGYIPNPHGIGGLRALYSKQDVVPITQKREWLQLIHAIDAWWRRLFSPACRRCKNCQRFVNSPVAQQLNCSGNGHMLFLRSVFTGFLSEVSRLGSITAWWHEHQADGWRREQCSAWGVVLIYLLDRRLLHLSYDELLRLEPIYNKNHRELTRLWRHRCPEEYAQFLQALSAANFRNDAMQKQTLIVLGFLILLKHGLSGVAELGRRLSPEEIQQVCCEHRLVKQHIGSGIFLPYPLTRDLCVGHVVLDDIRYYFWRYAASQEQRPGRHHWDAGPHHWEQMLVGAIEQALAAPVYEYATGILSRRPETEHRLTNPWRFSSKGKLADTGYALLPVAVQEHLIIYFCYCHQEQHSELATLRGGAHELIHFFTWIRRQEKLAPYPHWPRESAQEIFRAYASIECAEVKASSLQARLKHLAHFFSTLETLEYPVPAGYRLLYTMARAKRQPLRDVPREEIMDRVFRDGVCHLSYDPLSRLVLTIQYYCGTRVTETCELHLFCLLEDPHGHAYLLIPKGKSKEERPFPIVELGMGPLLEYMDEVVALRLSPDGTPRTLGKTNLRYLDDDPERALDWHYLFDRVPTSDGPVKKRGRLSSARVVEALQEALRIAAKTNPEGLFQQETYNVCCQYRRRKGLKCHYFAAQDGITICPCCGSNLSGKRGTRCRHILEQDFMCDGEAESGELFCPKCDRPLAQFLPITPHVFRHNSVSRAHRVGISTAVNMRLHGHQTLTMHLRYLHLLLKDTTNEVRQIFAEKRLRDVRQVLGPIAGKIVEGGIAYTISLEHYLGITLQRALKRRTYGIWGGFWAGALAQRGVASPLSAEDEIVIPEDTYEHTVAQYWYEALGLAVSEVAFEQITGGKWHAEVPSFLDRHKIEALVQFHLHHIQDSFTSTLGQRLMETDILEQRRFLDDLAEKLRPWWQHLGTIDQLVEMFAPGGGHAFHKQLPPTEPAS
jgi:site-specific recombinase XerD